jgi:hypothetical protein
MSSTNDSCNNLTYEQMANWFQSKTASITFSTKRKESEFEQRQNQLQDAWLEASEIAALQVAHEEAKEFNQLKKATFEDVMKGEREVKKAQ